MGREGEGGMGRGETPRKCLPYMGLDTGPLATPTTQRGQKMECQRVTLMWVILPSSKSLLITACNLISNVTLERKLGKGLGPGREALISPLEAYSELNKQTNGNSRTKLDIVL